MARTGRPSRPPPSLSKSKPAHRLSQKPSANAQKNAAGYAKRLSQKSQKSQKSGESKSRSLEDVYEYAPPGRVRRAGVRLELDRDERVGMGGSGSEDDGEDGERGGREARLLGDGEEVGSEDDEEIDSDGAFEESDEERFAGFDFGRGGKSVVGRSKDKGRERKLPEVDLNEEDDDDDDDDDEDSDDDEEEEGESGDFFDVLEVFDGKAEEEEDRSKKVKETQGPKVVVDDDDDDDDDEDVEDDGEDVDDDDDAEIDAASDTGSKISASDTALHSLSTFISTLPTSQKRKAGPSPPDDGAPKPKRTRRLKERTEAGPEGEFGAQASGLQKLNLDDLLAPLASSSSSSSALASLKKSTKPLLPTPSTTTTKKSKTPKTLPAPLPHRTQERLDREAAYEQTKTEVDTAWSATMKRIRQAEHLSFPLQAPPLQARASGLELAARFKPTTPLESAVSTLLASAALHDPQLGSTESLLTAHLSPEDVARRRAELRTMRELAFRADRKAARVARIKSKAYRRIRKKQRERLDGDEGGGAGAGDGDGDEQEQEEARLKAEIARARERATLRHKHTGKWARAAMRREGADPDQRREIGEMLERGERLRRRIRGEGSGEDEDSGSGSGSGSEDDDEEEGGGEGGGTIKRRAFEELARLRTTDASSAPADAGGKSVFGMKFMRDAAARRERATAAAIDDFAREMGVGDGDDELGVGGSDAAGYGDGELGAGASDADHAVALVQRTGGRVSFRPGGSTGAANVGPKHASPSDTSSVTLQSADIAVLSPTDVKSGGFGAALVSAERGPASSSKRTDPAGPAPQPSDSNPWLAPAATGAARKKKNEVLVHKGADALAKAASRIAKASGKAKSKVRAIGGEDGAGQGEGEESGDADAVLDISVGPEAVLKLPGGGAKGGSAKGNGEAEVEGSTKAGSREKKGSADAREKKGRSNAGGEGADDSDVPSEVEEQEREMERGRRGAGTAKGTGKGAKAFEQRDLVALAFAGDNVVQAFEEAKRREEEEDAPRVVDTTLPGWGSWAGTGTTPRAPRPHLLKAVPGIVPAARADARKPTLIISEKRDKKAARYLVRELPHPYTSAAQYERGMGVPIGAEWNTRVGFQRGTVPRVVKKMGTVIDPLEKLF
ncbi:Utp14-domain-containing protein [Leucogyrophana mollusca]|uniref:Utp14-domain-containing protein n=1 Tax=Leucogyrophana mollusca TaxID=85980 RepID=A0ACB8BEB9_9AGAM|nr:Utp14-domain-containing protein [Leucogyrophana mollusca]